MRNFIFGVIFAGFFAMAGAAAASTVTGGASFEDVWTAIVDLRNDAGATSGDLNALKLQLAAKAAQDALDRQAIVDELEKLQNRDAGIVKGGGIAHSEHYVLGDASFQGIR